MGGPMTALPKLPTLKAKVALTGISSATKINNTKVKDSIWNDIITKHAAAGAKEFGNFMNALESNFSKAAKTQTTTTAAPTQPTVTIQSFVDGKLQNQMMLTMGYLKMSHQQFRDAVYNMDANALQKTTIESLGKVGKEGACIYPGQDVIDQIVEFDKPENLHDVDKLFLLMSKTIPRQKERFITWNFAIQLMANSSSIVSVSAIVAH